MRYWLATSAVGYDVGTCGNDVGAYGNEGKKWKSSDQCPNDTDACAPINQTEPDEIHS